MALGGMSGSLEARLSYLRARVMIGRGKWCSVIVVENNIPFAINQRQPDPFGRRTDFLAAESMPASFISSAIRRL